MRRIPPSWGFRAGRGLRAAGKIVGSYSAVALPVLAVSRAVEISVAPPWIWAAGGLCLVHGIRGFICGSRSEHLPDIVVDEDGVDGVYAVEICDEGALREANALTKPYYRSEYVDDEVAEARRRRNPRGFVAIRNAAGELCAVFSVLALEESFGAQFVKGRVVDKQMEGGDIKEYEEARTARELYIGGVVVRDPEGAQGKRRACVMFWTMVEYLREMYGGRRRRTIYALAVSRAGEATLKRFGFAVASGKGGRRDGLDLYGLEWNAAAISRVVGRIGDRSRAIGRKSFDVGES